jgi:hypothetical protein
LQSKLKGKKDRQIIEKKSQIGYRVTNIVKTTRTIKGQQGVLENEQEIWECIQDINVRKCCGMKRIITT